jgi:RNA polymerase sigma-70 factor, ECF subfamily
LCNNRKNAAARSNISSPPGIISATISDQLSWSSMNSVLHSLPQPGVPGDGGISNDNERDLDLLHRVVKRDRAAFTELYLIHYRRLARFLTRMTSHHDVIEDVINDALWIVWQKAAVFRGDSLVSTWIVGIAYRCALKALRKTSSIRPSHSDETPVAPDSQLANENREWLHHAMEELPLEQRMVLELAYLMGLSCEEVAAVMQCPVNTVKTRMFYAREKLRHSLPRLAGKQVK